MSTAGLIEVFLVGEKGRRLQNKLERTAAAMKLDVNALRYITPDEFRVLTAVELGQRNVRGDVAWMCRCVRTQP